MKRTVSHLVTITAVSLLLASTGCQTSELQIDNARSTDSSVSRFASLPGAAKQDSDNDGLTDDEEGYLGTDAQSKDTDGDGLTDGAEVKTHNTNPLKKDTDNGGVNDGEEINVGTNPKVASDDSSAGGSDPDKDGLSNDEENTHGTNPIAADTDGDGLSDGDEVKIYGTNPISNDSDEGGLLDGVEISLGRDPNNADDDLTSADTDSDGLTNSQEKLRGTDPYEADTDGDGLSDGAEVLTYKTNPLKKDTDEGGINDGVEVGSGKNPLNGEDDISNTATDTDQDGLSDEDENTQGTNPNMADTDEDGLLDGAEIYVHGTNPLKSDSDEGGMDDGDEIAQGRNPLNANDDFSMVDKDLDGLLDCVEIGFGTDVYNPDTDGDGLLDGAEVFTHSTDPKKKDTDMGGLNDGYEISHKLNPNYANDDAIFKDGDADKDGLTNGEEMELGTDLNDRDTDGDGLSDGAEVNTYKTNPKKADTDMGGMIDGMEVDTGRNPLDPADDKLVEDENCHEEVRKGVFLDPSNTRKIRKSIYLGPIENFTGSLSAAENYGYASASANPGIGPTPEKDTLKVFFYEGSDGVSLMFYSGAEGAADADWRNLKMEILTKKNSGKDSVLVSDDPAELTLASTENNKKLYQAMLRYKNNSDGGAIGPMKDSAFIHINFLDISGIDSAYLVSNDGTEYALKQDGEIVSFILGTERKVVCEDPELSTEITWVQTPSNPTEETSGQFLWDLSNPSDIKNIECRLDVQNFQSCESKNFNFNNLTAGMHKFDVKVTLNDDKVTEFSYLWEVKAAPPVVPTCENSTPKVKTVSITFDEYKEGCQWGQGENLETRAFYVQAIRRQMKTLNLPQNSEICEAELNIDQDWEYNDFFALSMNGVVIASDMNFALSQNQAGEKVFDWNSAKGIRFDWGDRAYCYGQDAGSGCEVPDSGIFGRGEVRVNISKENLTPLTANSTNDQHQFELVVTGDNNGTLDCRNDELTINYKIYYVDQD